MTNISTRGRHFRDHFEKRRIPNCRLLLGMRRLLSSRPSGRRTPALKPVTILAWKNLEICVISWATDKTYKALFEAQRRYSLLKRIQATSHIDFTFSANHRANGEVHNWAREALYVSDMRTVNGRNDETSWTPSLARPT
ncbi:hypothetical protein J3E69DRAFT_346827 [Trichoderma sp. SZMC 28015]